MFEESVPKVEQEQGREAGESGNEVTFEGANVFFGQVCPVVIGGTSWRRMSFSQRKRLSAAGYLLSLI